MNQSDSDRNELLVPRRIRHTWTNRIMKGMANPSRWDAVQKLDACYLLPPSVPLAVFVARSLIRLAMLALELDCSLDM